MTGMPYKRAEEETKLFFASGKDACESSFRWDAPFVNPGMPTKASVTFFKKAYINVDKFQV